MLRPNRSTLALTLAFPLVCSCASTTDAGRANDKTASTPPTDPDSADHTSREVPALCAEKYQPLDSEGRALLVELVQHLVQDVFIGDSRKPPHRDGLINALEVNDLLRQFPTAEMVFQFPITVALPATSYRARFAPTTESFNNADHMVFTMKVSEVEMVRSGGQTALVYNYTAGPSGKGPENAIFMWGFWGTLCTLRGADGTWPSFPLGPYTVSML